MGKPWALENEEKVEAAWPSLCEKNLQGAQKETGSGYLGAAKSRERILGKSKKQLAGSWIAQGNMLMGTRNEERHVPSVAYNSEEKTLETGDDLGTNTYEGKLGILERAVR